MKAERDGGRKVVATETALAQAQAPSEGVLRLRARNFCSACRQVFGIPDYERYLAHAASRHPGASVLTRSEFCVQAIERRYGKGGGARCC